MEGGVVISLARTGVAHTITRPLGDRVPHGLATAVALPCCMQFNLEAATSRYANVAVALGCERRDSDLDTARLGIDRVAGYVAALGLPARLRDLDISESELPALAQTAHNLEISGLNPRALDVESLLALYRRAW
jgi:alcohol dehydrogenase class IV